MEFCKFKLNNATYYGIPVTVSDGIAKVLTSQGYMNVPSSLLCEADKAHNPTLFNRLSGQILAEELAV